MSPDIFSSYHQSKLYRLTNSEASAVVQKHLFASSLEPCQGHCITSKRIMHVPAEKFEVHASRLSRQDVEALHTLVRLHAEACRSEQKEDKHVSDFLCLQSEK